MSAISRKKIANINNNGIATTVVVIGQGLGDNLTVSGGTFINNGKTDPAKSISYNMTEGVANITVTFPFSNGYKNASISLTVNGEDIPFDWEDFRNSAKTVVVGNYPTSAQSSTIVINGNSSVIGDMKIYLDGVEITEAQLRELNSDIIASIEVDKESNVLKITSKE